MSKKKTDSGKAASNDNSQSTWVVATGTKIKLAQPMADKLTARLVADRYKVLHPGTDQLPTVLDTRRIQMIVNPKGEGVVKTNFIDSVQGLADIFEEMFLGKSYGEIADNVDALGEESKLPVVPPNSSAAAPNKSDFGSDSIAENEKSVSHHPNSGKEIVRAPTQYPLIIGALSISLLGAILFGIYYRNQCQRLVNEIAGLTTLVKQVPDPTKLPSKRSYVSNYLHHADPTIFYGSLDGVYDVARVNFCKRAEYDETAFTQEVGGSQFSFDMLINNGGFVRETLIPLMEEGLRRGVRYRLVLTDYRTSNRWSDLFRKEVGDKTEDSHREPSKDNHQKLHEFLERVNGDKASNPNTQFTGSVVVKWNQKFLFNTMWIRDGGGDEAIAHLGMHFYRGKNSWPSIRVSKKTAPDMVRSVEQEFRMLFDEALDFDAVPLPDFE